jgi:RNA polymerase sigma factor (sigma-70 family)
MSEDDDQRRIERCFREHSPAIARYFLRRCATAGDAEEAVTDVFAIAWRRIDRLPPEPETRLWLFGVARNVLADQRRAARRRARLGDRLSATAPPATAAAPDPTAATVEALAVRDAWRSLPEGDRELLALVAWDGLEVGEIARVLRLPAPVVSARLYRARRRLAHRLSHLESRSAAAPCPSTT